MKIIKYLSLFGILLTMTSQTFCAYKISIKNNTSDKYSNKVKIDVTCGGLCKSRHFTLNPTECKTLQMGSTSFLASKFVCPCTVMATVLDKNGKSLMTSTRAVSSDSSLVVVSHAPPEKLAGKGQVNINDLIYSLEHGKAC